MKQCMYLGNGRPVAGLPALPRERLGLPLPVRGQAKQTPDLLILGPACLRRWMRTTDAGVLLARALGERLLRFLDFAPQRGVGGGEDPRREQTGVPRAADRD